MMSDLDYLHATENINCNNSLLFQSLYSTLNMKETSSTSMSSFKNCSDTMWFFSQPSQTYVILAIMSMETEENKRGKSSTCWCPWKQKKISGVNL